MSDDLAALKLALVRQRYTPFGGAERFLQGALDALRARGLAVSLITRAWDADTPAAGMQILRCRALHIGRLWRTWAFTRCVRHHIAGGRFDIVQSHERVPGCDIYRAGDGVHATWVALLGQARGRLGRIGLAASPFHRYLLALERAMFAHPRLAAVICNSQMVRADIARRFGVADDKLHVIYNAVDSTHFHPGLAGMHRHRLRSGLGVAEATPVMLFVGSGFERKGVAALVDALAQMRSRRTELWIVGADRRMAAYQARARRSGVAGRLRFLGPQRDVRPYLGAADAFVLPSLYDPMPNAALEALASGLPVLAGRDTGAAELIREGENGFVVAPRDVAAIARAMDALSAPGAAAAMGGAARAAVVGLSPAAMTDRLLALYESLIAQRLGGRPATGARL